MLFKILFPSTTAWFDFIPVYAISENSLFNKVVDEGCINYAVKGIFWSPNPFAVFLFLNLS